jgi:hypothetical protein
VQSVQHRHVHSVHALLTTVDALTIRRRPQGDDVLQCYDFSELKLLVVRLFLRLQAIFSAVRRVH